MMVSLKKFFILEIVPVPPANVKVQVTDARAVNVSWDAPKFDKIPMYVVYYKKQGDDRYSTVRIFMDCLNLLRWDMRGPFLFFITWVFAASKGHRHLV